MPMKEYLLTAGPTPVPERVLLAMARPILYHRAPAFTECLKETQEGLKWLLQTKQLPLILAGSGTIGMDAAVSNFLRTGDKAVVIRGGKFGERWGKICQGFGIECVFIDVEWGKSVDPKAVAEAIDKNPGVRAVYATASETSTAVRHDIEGISNVVKGKPDVLLCVDAITAVGVFDVPMDKWGLDVVVVGSQKALMLPPGLAVVAVSDKAWKANERSNLPRFYNDLLREKKSQEKGETAFTPAVSLVVGLRESLRMLKEETLEGVFERHERLAKATRAAAGGLGLELFSSSPTNRHPRAERHRRFGRGQADAHPLRHHHRRRPGPPQGQDRAHRAHRVLQRVRHHHGHLRPGDDAQRSRLQHPARGGCGGGAGDLRRHEKGVK
jgi:aspartate aminotransferase-like enzyme